MNSMEESSTNLPKPTSTQSLNSLSTSTVDLRSPGQRWPYDEDVMSRNSRTDQQDQQVLEDLMAFESRLRELGTDSRAPDSYWAPFFGTIFACSAISACHLVPRVRDSQFLLLRSISSRGAFTISLATLVLTIIFGVKHVFDRKRNGAVDLSRDTLNLFQLERGKRGELVGIPKS